MQYFIGASCISLPASTPSHCTATRRFKLTANRNIYKLNKPPRIPSGDPNKPANPENLQSLLLFPLVNLTYNQSIAISSQDVDELPWLLTYRHIQTISKRFLDERMKPRTYLYDEYNTTEDFYHLFQLVRKLFTVRCTQ